MNELDGLRKGAGRGAGLFFTLGFENTEKTHRPSFEKIVACFKSFSYHLEKSQALIRLDTTALHL